jgi:hypothetical protein
VKRSKAISNLILVALVAVGVGAGAMAYAATTSDDDRVDNDKPGRVYPVNERGITYGSALGANSPADEPDLILAYGVDGTLGYVLKTDLYGEDPASPEVAAARATTQRVSIPLYAEDGTTVIGEFVLEGGKSSELTQP